MSKWLRTGAVSSPIDVFLRGVFLIQFNMDGEDIKAAVMPIVVDTSLSRVEKIEKIDGVIKDMVSNIERNMEQSEYGVDIKTSEELEYHDRSDKPADILGKIEEELAENAAEEEELKKTKEG